MIVAVCEGVGTFQHIVDDRTPNLSSLSEPAINWLNMATAVSDQLTSPLREKSTRLQRSNAKKQKTASQKRDAASVGRATVPVTPQMIRGAVKELQTRRVYVSSALIASQLRRCYPIERDPDALEQELNAKLNCAVHVGLIAKCGHDKYCIPTLREQASMNKTAVTAFWDMYYTNSGSSTTEQDTTFGIPRTRAQRKRITVSSKYGYDSVSNDPQDLHIGVNR